tara:strand:+ start:436 stop:1626 length:1191 start_codon:yes stop_codon:yes gene_type:complete
MDGDRQQTETIPGRYEDAALGFRNHWYPAMLSDEIIEEQLVPLTLLGENLLFKRIDGVVYAIADQCIHRGFRFSTKPECYTKNSITCWLHAFTYNFKDGKLVAIPSAPDSRLIGKRGVKSYPVQEVNGMVFAFVGDLEPPPPLIDDVPPGFLDEQWCTVGAVNVPAACNWRLAADSGFDPNHIFIHKDDEFLKVLDRPFPIANRLVGGDTFHEITEVTGDGPKGLIDALGKSEPVFEFEFECDGERGRMASRIPANEMAHMAYGSIEGSIWLPGALKVEPWPDMGMLHYEWYVPVDEKNHRYFIAWGRKTTDPLECAAFREEVKTKWVKLGFEQFNATDLVANMGVEVGTDGLPYRSTENLFEGDGYTLVWRRLASRHNRGLQQRPTQKAPAQTTE